SSLWNGVRGCPIVAALTGAAAYRNQASTMPALAAIVLSTASMSVTAPLHSWAAGGKTGVRKRAKRVPAYDGMPTAQPARNVSTASTTSGNVITHGDSWTWWATSRDLRGPPKNVRKTSRNEYNAVMNAPRRRNAHS